MKCGILKSESSSSLVLGGDEFNKMVKNENGDVDQEKLDALWPQLSVLARSKPRDKFTLHLSPNVSTSVRIFGRAEVGHTTMRTLSGL